MIQDFKDIQWREETHEFLISDLGQTLEVKVFGQTRIGNNVHKGQINYALKASPSSNPFSRPILPACPSLFNSSRSHSSPHWQDFHPGKPEYLEGWFQLRSEQEMQDGHFTRNRSLALGDPASENPVIQLR